MLLLGFCVHHVCKVQRSNNFFSKKKHVQKTNEQKEIGGKDRRRANTSHVNHQPVVVKVSLILLDIVIHFCTDQDGSYQTCAGIHLAFVIRGIV